MSENHPAKLGIIVLESCRDFGVKVDLRLQEIRATGGCNRGSFLVRASSTRFANGEGKVTLHESVRGKDIYILSDIGNYSCTYEMFGQTTRVGPDEHFQDIKRAISAIAGTAWRITVVMPLLYASRQHKRKGRESLDCAIALQELQRMGVSSIITFDAHDPRVQNAIPLTGFENLNATFEIVERLVRLGVSLDRSKMVVVSPDTGAMDRAIYYGDVLGLDVGLFYKQRSYETAGGKNPIVQHHYMGPDLAGRAVLVVDDMIASGDSVLSLAQELKKRGATDIYVCVTFALFTEGVAHVQRAFEASLIKSILATNLTYIPPTLRKCKWFKEVDMASTLASVIDRLNRAESLSSMFDATEKIHSLLKKRATLS
jgi:ribose-phosphate pyrophosphokinase